MAPKNANLYEVIIKLCEDFSLHLENRNENSFKVFTDHSSGLSVFFILEEQGGFSFYFSQRTYSIAYEGDRSDVHVIFSLMFASFIRLFDTGISCSLFDIPHPVVPDEIWGRYIMPVQIPSLLGISTLEQQIEKISSIIKLVALWRTTFWTFAGCSCEECMNEGCMKEKKIDYLRDYELPEEISNSVKKVFKSPFHVNYGNRLQPMWHYYYDIDNEVTIIKSPKLSSYVKSIIKWGKRNSKDIEGINGTLIIDGEIRNFFSNSSKKQFDKLIKLLLNSKRTVAYTIIPLENMIITVVGEYIIALGRLAGIDEFKLERELLRNRHNRESELLFPIPLFEWNINPCPEQFEKLVKSLLEREPNIKSVRIPAPINQGDKSRDLIIEWSVLNQNVASDEQPPISLIKVVGQCKVSNSTVGKSKVLDIRDTVETHSSVGYFLAVSSQISAPLTEKLEELQSRGIWTNWWNREDIELRLSKNQDLLPQFSKVLKAKNKIKFVDKE